MASNIKELLDHYPSPKAAAKAAGTVRTAGYHWFSSPPVIPGDKALIAMAADQNLSEEQTNLILVDAARKRIERRSS